jgi:branched-chain amino acid transport system ATP-binding protein
MALQFSKRGYVLENGNLVMEGVSSVLLHNPDVTKTYLGG